MYLKLKLQKKKTQKLQAKVSHENSVVIPFQYYRNICINTTTKLTSYQEWGLANRTRFVF